MQPLALYVDDLVHAAYDRGAHKSYDNQIGQRVTQISSQIKSKQLDIVSYDKAAADLDRRTNSGYKSRLEFRLYRSAEFGTEQQLFEGYIKTLDKIARPPTVERALDRRLEQLLADCNRYQIAPRELATFCRIK